MDVIEKLNKLGELKAEAAVIQGSFQIRRESILTPEIREKLAELDAEETTSLLSLGVGISTLEIEIKDDVIAQGATVKGDHLMAVYNKGRVTWDTKALECFAAAHPELSKLRKESEPTVSIRSI